MIAASAALLTPRAGAQNASPQVEEISVTGSRIALTSGMETPVPVTSLTTVELFNQAPGNTISQQLDVLPQFFNNGSPQRGDGGNPSVGSGGPGALNIRNLNSASTGAGISRTLTLLDGARVVPTDKRGTVNVDMFPTALMRSVDVVTGGASAAYGADALGGVVNFVLNRQFEGLKVSVGSGMHEYNSTGKQYEVSIAGGQALLDKRLHLIGSLEARHIDEVYADRTRWDNSQYQWGYVTNPAWVAAGCTVNVYCAAGPQRLTVQNVATLTGAPTGLIRGTGTSLDWKKFSLDGSHLEPFDLGTLAALPGTRGTTSTLSGGPEAEINYKTASLGPSGMEVVSRSSLFGAQYDLTDNFSAFVQAMVGRTESNDVTANANFSYTDNFAPRIAIDNVFLPEEVKQVMRASNMTEIAINKTSQQFDGRPELGSTRRGKNVFTQWQYSVGVNWEFAEKWNLRASWQRGESKRNSTAYNLLQVDRAQLGMDAVRDPATGKIVCRVQLFNPTLEQLRASVADRISNVPLDPHIPAGTPGNTQPLPYPVEPRAISECIPFNYMGSGNMSQAAIDYVGTDRFNIGYVNQDFAEALVTGKLSEGWGAGPIGFAGGLTWRDQSFYTYATPLDVDMLGPMVNVPSLGIRGLGPGYSTSTALNLFSGIPKIAGDSSVWEWFSEISVPVWQSQNNDQRLDTDVAFRRSTYDRSGAIDSWKIGASWQIIKDLRLRLTKSRDVREPSFAELFDAQGSGETITDPSFGGSATLINTIRGGNRDLRPEYATTNTLGFVYQPSFTPLIEGLSVSLDYYDVNIKDAVARLTAQRIVDSCFDTKSPELCSLIARDPATNVVTQVQDVFLNVAAARTRGLDLELTYRKEVSFFADHRESVSLRGLAGRTFERSDTAPNSTALNKAGFLGMPALTANVSGTYSIDNYSVQLQAQYVDAVKRDANGVWVQGIQVDDNHVASMTWFNARLGYNGELRNGSTWTLAFNVQNLLNRDPPRFGGANNTYDQYGRRYNLSLNFNW
ncbi:MAG: TonB-dependent receptor [Pseudomonadales bacterium]|nr:TonB-dependent receptor [Pseudomonadales bacterium]